MFGGRARGGPGATFEAEDIGSAIENAGARTVEVEEDLTDVDAPSRIFDTVNEAIGSVVTTPLCCRPTTAKTLTIVISRS